MKDFWRHGEQELVSLMKAVKNDDPSLIPDTIPARRVIRPFRHALSYSHGVTSFNVLEQNPIPVRILDWVFESCQQDTKYLYAVICNQIAYRQVEHIQNYVGSIYFARGAGYLLQKMLMAQDATEAAAKIADQHRAPWCRIKVFIPWGLSISEADEVDANMENSKIDSKYEVTDREVGLHDDGKVIECFSYHPNGLPCGRSCPQRKSPFYIIRGNS